MSRRPVIKSDAQRTVLITGATSGIGSAIAIRFAQGEWNVICHYNSAVEKAYSLKEEIEASGLNCFLLKADLASKKQVLSLCKKLKGFQIDSMINNAGTYVVNKHFSKLTIEDIESTFMINTTAPMIISATVFMGMKERGFGRIINISSIAAKYGGSAYSLHYGCSKRALEGITKTLAKEGASCNVLVNTIRPGVIDTEFHKKFPKDMKNRIEMIPVKRMGIPQDVADMVYYLGSDENRFITNEVITVSGGE